ncbi:MAG: PEP-CTERM sorting domain-containing protein [Stigonema ocellatum SAG 48.90 = DSM 106950]|nr:PEP-CTERM sorting domain-containing protein [Stigonema ocellatum SAG 48.90 = DSM 106950]
MKTKLFTVLAAATTFAGVLATTGSANAAVLTESGSLNAQQTDYSNRPIDIQQFNSSLGQLNRVNIFASSDYQSNATFSPITATTSSSTPSSSSTIVSYNFLGTANLKLNNQNLITLHPTASYGPAEIDNLPATISLTDSKSKSIDITDPNSLQSFIGTGNLNFLFSASNFSSVGIQGNAIGTFVSQADAYVRVTYDYTAAAVEKAPEPSALLGVGLVAAFGLLSKRNRSFSKA